MHDREFLSVSQQTGEAVILSTTTLISEQETLAATETPPPTIWRR